MFYFRASFKKLALSLSLSAGLLLTSQSFADVTPEAEMIEATGNAARQIGSGVANVIDAAKSNTRITGSRIENKSIVGKVEIRANGLFDDVDANVGALTVEKGANIKGSVVSNKAIVGKVKIDTKGLMNKVRANVGGVNIK
jgi:hypothetical protein